MGELLAFVDGSIYSQSVCDHTAWIAERKQASVLVAHVLGHRQGVKSDLSGNIGLGARSALLEELAELDQVKARLARKRGRAILEDAADRIGAVTSMPVETRLRNGDLVESLAELETDKELILIGKRGEAADFAKMHLGSNLERVVRSTTKPVLVCSREFKPVERFMIAFDGGPSAIRAVEHVAKGQIFPGIPCKILSVGQEGTDARRAAEGAAATLKDAGYEVELEFAPGQAEVVVPERIKQGEAGLLVMGAYRRSRLQNMIIGSTTTETIRACHIPLLLFR